MNCGVDEIITYIKNTFDKIINAVEIIIPKQELKNFKLSQENYKWLSSLEWLSYHLLADNCYSLETKIIHLLPPLNAIICHSDKIENLRKHKHFFMPFKNIFLFENIENDNFKEFDYLDYNGETSKYVCLDISHLLGHDKKTQKCFLQDNLFKVREIHLSNYKEQYHQCFYNNSKQLKYIKNKLKIRLQDYPIIIEESFETFQQTNTEIDFLRRAIYG